MTMGEDVVRIVDALFHEMAERNTGGLAAEDWANGSWLLFERGCLRLVDDGKHMGYRALWQISCRTARAGKKEQATG
jgi:hypothetical protein